MIYKATWFNNVFHLHMPTVDWLQQNHYEMYSYAILSLSVDFYRIVEK
jgi:hypothetical protein